MALLPTCFPENTGQNVGVAFALVIGAGMASLLGGIVIFILPYTEERVNIWLAAALSLAAGVMLYVSFLEIFAVKAIDAFNDCIENEGLAYLYATLCFFGGALICWVMDWALHKVDHWLLRRTERRAQEYAEKRLAEQKLDEEPHEEEQQPVDVNETDEEATRTEAGVLPSSEGQVDTQQATTEPVETLLAVNAANEVGVADQDEKEEIPAGCSMHVAVDEEVMHEGQMVAALYEAADQLHDDEAEQKEKRELVRMGLFTAVAIAIHNFPEGLATFVATLNDPAVGVSVAIAIGVHNIPEGMCVAVPIYYATGSKWKAVFWAGLSGSTEILGAVLGWAVLATRFSQLAYGILFGLVAGMMVYISLAELLPTAHRYDPTNRVVTIGLIAGMAIMALSLVLFQL